jgi:hypothetical protein
LKTLLERVEYFQKLWSKLFPTAQVEDQQVINWLMSFSDPELEIVMSKASRRARMEPGTDLYRYISGTLAHRRNDAMKHVVPQSQEGVEPNATTN